jgi:histidinol dehydrogenase
VEAVRLRGDEAVRELTQRFDGVDVEHAVRLVSARFQHSVRSRS